MKKDDSVYLRHILDAISRIEEYTQDIKHDGFMDNYLIQDGVIRQIEIIGEATRRLPMEIKEKHPEIPWKDMSGMRDKRNYKRIRKGLPLWILKNVQITRYTFRCFVKCRLKKDCLKHLSCLNLPGSFLFMGYTRGSQILVMKNLKKYFWSVWINVTTGIIKEGYSST